MLIFDSLLGSMQPTKLFFTIRSITSVLSTFIAFEAYSTPIVGFISSEKLFAVNLLNKDDFPESEGPMITSFINL